ncbi:MAG: hypothetical protein FWH18_04430 [Marinilabiliaceae bacterium]|nr:hypothetical protein [Marinilabiliaceae bacterium]
MKRIFLRLVCFSLFLSVSILFAQDEPTKKVNNFKIGFEFGMNVMEGESIKPEQIRQNHYSTYYYNDYYYDYHTDYGLFGDLATLKTTYLGIKPEYFVYNNRIGIASGLRFTYASNSLVSDRNFFLWKLKEEGMNTYYVRINNIRQDVSLLAIPLEIRFFPNKRELPFQHYFKIGSSFNFWIQEDSYIEFADSKMEKYSEVIKKELPDRKNDFSVFVYASFGFKIGKLKENYMIPWGNIEFQFPYMMVTKNSFTFVGQSYYGVGFQVSLQVPIGKNVPIGSK